MEIALATGLIIILLNPEQPLPHNYDLPTLRQKLENNYTATIFDHYIDNDYYKYTEVYGEPISCISAHKKIREYNKALATYNQMVLEGNQQVTEPEIPLIEQQFLAMYNETDTFTVPGPVDQQFIPGKYPWDDAVTNHVNITHINSIGMYGQVPERPGELIPVEQEVYNKELHIHQLRRIMMYISKNKSKLGTWQEFLDSLESIRINVRFNELELYASLAAKMYCEIRRTELDFAPSQQSTKCSLHLRGGAVQHF